MTYGAQLARTLSTIASASLVVTYLADYYLNIKVLLVPAVALAVVTLWLALAARIGPFTSAAVTSVLSAAYLAGLAAVTNACPQDTYTQCSVQLVGISALAGLVTTLALLTLLSAWYAIARGAYVRGLAATSSELSPGSSDT